MKHFIITVENLISGMTACYSVITAKVNKLLDIVSADVVASAEDNSIDCDFFAVCLRFESVLIAICFFQGIKKARTALKKKTVPAV